MKHLFRATKIGWGKEQEGVWFDSDQYSAEEARAEFKPYHGTTQKGYDYVGYEYDGQKYHDVTYLGEFEDDEMPHDSFGLMDILLNRKKDGGKKTKDRFPDVDWYCDRCNAYLNTQTGFNDHHDVWECTECGHKNNISDDDIYESKEDFRNVNKR